MREELLKKFGKHCKKCSGLCCKEEAEFTVFEWELKKLPLEKSKLNIRNTWGNKSKNKDIRIERIGMKGRCIFAGNRGCKIKIEDRPLDCISYPIFPIIKYGKKEEKEIMGIMIHKSCPFAKEISEDKKLIELMLKFWEKELSKISKIDIKNWFGDKRNYWLDKNIIKIKYDKPIL